jgi:hypothetical protein
MPKIESLCENYIPRSSSQVPKDFPLLYGNDSPKYYKIFTMVFTIISTFYFFKASYSHIMLLQVLIQLTTRNYWMQIMSQKLQFLPVMYMKEKCGWIVNHIHLHLFPMYQTNYQVSFIIFHPSVNRFNIIWNLKFDQVHIPYLSLWIGLTLFGI